MHGINLYLFSRYAGCCTKETLKTESSFQQWNVHYLSKSKHSIKSSTILPSRLLRSLTVLSDLIKFSWISIKKGRQKIRTTRNFEKALLHRLNRGQKLCLIKGWTTLTPSNKLSSSRGGDLLYQKILNYFTVEKKGQIQVVNLPWTDVSQELVVIPPILFLSQIPLVKFVFSNGFSIAEGKTWNAPQPITVQPIAQEKCV